jgi:SAM-dependent methyltransferase
MNVMPHPLDAERFADAQSAELQNWSDKAADERHIRYELCEHAEVAGPLHRVVGERMFERGLEVGIGPYSLGFLAVNFSDHVRVIDAIDPLPRLDLRINDASLREQVEAIRARTNYRQSPGESIPAHNEAYDIVSCINVVDHASDPGQIVREIERVLAPGGILVFAVSTLSAIGEAKWRLDRMMHPDKWIYRAHPHTFQWRHADHMLRPIARQTLWCDRPSPIKRFVGHGRMSFWIKQKKLLT